MTPASQEYDFHYRTADLVIGDQTHHRHQVNLIVQHADLPGLINKIIRAVRDDVHRQYTTIPLRGLITTKQADNQP